VAETTTANYGWTMPDPGASANTWGATLNATTQKIDAQVFVNQTAINASQAPIGSISMFGSITPPAGWLICDGSSLLQTGAYAALFAIIGTTFGSVDSTHFTLPDLRGVFPSGASASSLIGAKGGAATVTLDATMIPAHTHPITDHTHTHGVTPVAHAHTDAGHSHGLGADSHTHDSGWANTGSGGAPGATGVLPIPGSGYRPTLPAATGITIASGFANIQAANATVTLAAAATGITATNNNAGGGAAHPNLPPFLSIPFIIRYA
jgi:microcystin-dependent protein